jgi:UDP-N-acetylmuramoyl-L-alanyl-D-glutamate--2,6-diaminopimelate ligase
MKLSELFPGSPDIDVSGVAADSRQVASGDLFVALEGASADGRRHIPEAISRGAVAILTDERPGEWSVPSIRTADPRRALARIAARFFPGMPATIVAVTGTNGKSSTVDFLRQIWSHIGYRAASVGTLGAIGPDGAIELGATTPDPVLTHRSLDRLARDGVTHCAIEASSHGLDQHRIDSVRLAVGVFTNLTQDHLDYHRDMIAYRTAKLRLFSELLSRGAPAVINADSPEREAFEAAARHAGLDVRTYGWRGDHVWFDEITPRGTGQDLRIQWEDPGGKDLEALIHLPLIGEFQAHNALAAAAAAIAAGAAPRAALEALSVLRGVRGRLELVGQTAEKAPVFVDYAHTPDGLDTLLRAARPHVPGRLILVFGCGGDRDRTKRPLMGDIARRLADETIVTDDNPRHEDPAAIRAAISAAIPGASEIGDRLSAIREGVRRLRRGDALLIAGKGHETGQVVGGAVLAFSDQEAARDALAEKNGGRP